MENIKIACDVDDVLGAFYPSLCKALGMPELLVNTWDGTRDCAWVAERFPELYDDEYFFADMMVLSNPKSITFDIDHYITSIPSKLHDIREDWLIRNGFPIRPLICTLGSKVESMKALGISVLIDDRPSTIKAVRDAGMIGIQFVPSYMNDYDESCPHTIKHLSQVEGIIENL